MLAITRRLIDFQYEQRCQTLLRCISPHPYDERKEEEENEEMDGPKRDLRSIKQLHSNDHRTRWTTADLKLSGCLPLNEILETKPQ